MPFPLPCICQMIPAFIILRLPPTTSMYNSLKKQQMYLLFISLLGCCFTAIDSTCAAGKFEIESKWENNAHSPYCVDDTNNYVVISKPNSTMFDRNTSIISLLEVELYEGTRKLDNTSLTFRTEERDIPLERN